MKFNKTNMRTGDMVEIRNGKRGTVMLDTAAGNIIRFHTEKDSFSYLDTRYNDDLTHTKHEQMDIVKVYRVDPNNIPANKIGDLIANVDKMIEFGKIVYERKSAPKLDELKTGDMLVHRNGKVSTVYKGTPFGDITRYHTEYNSFSYLSRYDNELKHESNDSFDIVAVYRANIEDTTRVGDLIGNPNKMISENNLVWSESDDINASWVYNGISGGFMTVSNNGEDEAVCEGNCSNCSGCVIDFDDEYEESDETISFAFDLISEDVD